MGTLEFIMWAYFSRLHTNRIKLILLFGTFPTWSQNDQTMSLDNLLLISGLCQSSSTTHKRNKIPVSSTLMQQGGGDTGGGTGGGTGTTTPPPYNIQAAPGYPWGPFGHYGDTLFPGSSLLPNEYITSKNGRYIAIYQNDGNFVIYDYGYGILDSNTSGRFSGGRLTMQSDGNLAIYDNNNWPAWDTNTSRRWDDGVYMIMQDDGNLVLYKYYGIDPAYYMYQWGQDLGLWDSHRNHGVRHW